MSKLVIVEDGSIKGWFIALLECVLVYGVWFISVFSETVTKNLKETGGFITGIFGLSFGVWLAYKGVSKYIDMKGDSGSGGG
jgi:hypothetical protein